MGQLAVILGSNALGRGGEEVVAAAARHKTTVLQRHDSEGAYVLPHRIDHAANLRRLREAGCKHVLAVASVGSLHEGLGVGSLVCPDDFIALHLGTTALDDLSAHRAPGFDEAWRERVLSAWQAGGATPIRDGGVYWQSIGPRFETPAEIRLMAAHADVVGMTIASECILAAELGLRYTAICMVDNLANGVAAEQISLEEVERERAANVARLRDALDALLPALEA